LNESSTQPLTVSGKRLVILVSGGGTNLQALIDANAEGKLAAEIVLVVSNRRDAYALTRADRVGIPTLTLSLKTYTKSGKSREEYDADLAEQVKQAQPDLIVLAGWMHILSPSFLNEFPNQVINLHPALPGMFPGTHAIERAFEAWQRGEITESGCMVHYTIPEVDAGEVIAQRIVPFMEGDMLEDYQARLHAAEHTLMVEAVGLALANCGT
jgi:formyltetrahydrofolate-dependent phosphoribosylglycinamide formyltransferase